MHYRYSGFLIYVLFLLDICCILGVVCLLNLHNTPQFLGHSSSAVLLWSTLYFTLKAYNTDRHAILKENILRTAKAGAAFGIIYILLWFVIDDQQLNTSISLSLGVFGSLIALRFVFANSIMWYRSKGYNFRKVLYVGHHPLGFELMERFQNESKYGMRVLGYFGSERDATIPFLGTVGAIEAYFKTHSVDEVFCGYSPSSSLSLSLQKVATDHFVKMRYVGNLNAKFYKNQNVVFFDHIPVAYSQSEPLDLLHNRLTKRTFDIVLSIGILLVCLPFFPLIALGIKLSSKGPIFFIQQRSGLANKTFGLIKFRTMRQNDEADSKQATENDPRVTRFGKWLRRNNIDELPQFVNVLMGNMTVVGPRPHMLRHTEEYAAIINRFMARHAVKPGITGWAQINGFRGETKTTKDMRERVTYDIAYIENWNLWFDVKIVMITMYQFIFGKNTQKA